MSVYFNDFDDRADVIKNFEIKDSDLENANVLFASYGGGSYEGDAIVILTREDDVFEVHGSHCSCHGLEDQWDEEKTSWESLFERYVKNEKHYFEDEHGVDAKIHLKALIEYEIMERHLLTED